jgi:hypothetical protein
MRCAEDAAHAANVAALADVTVRRPVTDAILDAAALRPLSALDVRSDPLWHDAVLITGTNAVRQHVNRERVLVFAQQHGVPVYAWRLPLPVQVSAGLSPSDIDNLYHAFPELVVYFVEGAPAMLVDNVQPALGLANGSQVRLHSFTLEGGSEVHSELEAAARRAMEAGSVIVWVRHPVLSVNVAVTCSDPDAWPDDCKLQGVVCGRDEVVVPLWPYSKTATTLKSRRAREAARAIFTYRPSVFDLAFALTYHKCQGATIPRVILDVSGANGRTLRLAALYVAFSRVRRGDHIRTLPGQDRGAGTLDHLKKLEHEPDLVSWYDALEPVSRSERVGESSEALEFQFSVSKLKAQSRSTRRGTAPKPGPSNGTRQAPRRVASHGGGGDDEVDRDRRRGDAAQAVSVLQPPAAMVSGPRRSSRVTRPPQRMQLTSSLSSSDDAMSDS